MIRLALSVAGAVGVFVLAACSNPFAPAKHNPEGTVTERPPAGDADTPSLAMVNLERAFNNRDEELYESLLDEDFWFTEPDCLGDLEFSYGRETELELMAGSRDGSEPGVFDVFRTIEYEFDLIRRKTELGRDYPKTGENDIYGHPDEDWENFYATVRIVLRTDDDDGFNVDQKMTFKLREDENGIWKIIRWADDPLSGDCGGAGDDGGDGEAGKPVASGPIGSAPWSVAKQSLR